MSTAFAIENNKKSLSSLAAVPYVSIQSNRLFQWHQALLVIEQRLIQREFSLEDRFTCLSTVRDTLFDIYPSIHELPQDVLQATYTTLVNIAYYLCDWSLIIFLYQEAKFINNNTVATSISLADAYCQIGRYTCAKQAIETSLLCTPFNNMLIDYWKRLHQHEKQYPNTITVVDKELSLVRLEPHHLNDFSWQYNSSIMELCNLPHFIQDEDWYTWYEQACSDNTAITCAIIHQEWGFIGVVHLKVINGVGFFYYWLGNDFQGAGLGPRAVNLLLHYGMAHMHMQCCYAKVYQHNVASHKAIKKLGFTRLPITADLPYNNEVFYYLGIDKSSDILFTELRDLLKGIGSQLRILPNQCIRGL
jgi:RimJ/RimL family protein N-acetyltransferase